jgi:hypothetical protein
MYRDDEGSRVFGVFTFGKLFVDGAPLVLQNPILTSKEQRNSSKDQADKFLQFIKGNLNFEMKLHLDRE